MPKVKLNIRDLPVPEKIARAQQIVTALTGNASFPTPQPALAQVTATVNDLDTAYAESQAARAAAKQRTTVLNQAEETFDRILSQLAGYVESVSGGDEAMIQSAGMDVRAASTPAGTLDAPTNLNATQGDQTGEINLQWDKTERARSYVIEKSADPPTATSWSHAAVSTRSQVTIEGLTTGTTYWFRVAALGARRPNRLEQPRNQNRPLKRL